MYDDSEIPNKTELEQFLDKNTKQTVWFATAAGLFEGMIQCIFNTPEGIFVELQSCIYLTNNKNPQIEKIKIKADSIFAWGTK